MSNLYPTPRTDIQVIATCSGNKFSYRAKLSIDKVTGEKLADVGEKFDLDATIQTYRDSCDIATIIARYEAGDESVLNVRQGFSGDVTALPKDINDIVGTDGLFDDAIKSFDKLPADIKVLFNNDPAVFFKHVIDNTVNNIISNGKKPVEEPAPTDNKEGDDK